MRLPGDETALVKRAARCSAEAFEALLERHRSLLRTVVRRYAETRDDRDDLIQDVVARLLERQKKALRDWQPVAPFAAYLTTITSRQGIQVARQRARLPGAAPKGLPAGQSPAPLPVVPEDLAAPAVDSPEQRLVSAALAHTLRRAVAQLSPRDQLLIRLRFYEDLDAPGIGEVLGLSAGAARKAVFDALRRLERRLDAQQEELFGVG